MNQNPYSVGNNLDPQNDELQNSNIEASVRGMQIIAGALMAGVLVFFGVVLVTTGGDFIGRQPDILPILGAGLGVVAIVNHFIIPKIITRSQLKQIGSTGFSELNDDARTNQMCGAYRSQLIVALALLEGAAFFNLVALMIEKHIWSLEVVIVLVLFMALKFPTRDKVSFWVQDKVRELS